MKKNLLLLFIISPIVLLAQDLGSYANALRLKYENDLNKGKQLLKTPFLSTTPIEENGRTIAFDGFGDNGFPEYKVTCSNIGLAATVNANQLWPSGLLGLNLSGNGINALGIWDSGRIRLTHREFLGRVTQIDTPANFSTHSNNVAGLMIASGITSTAKGIAFQTNLKAWDFTNDRAEMALAGNGLLLSNHSYANSAAWIFSGGFQYWLGDTTLNATKDWKFGFYDSRTKEFDSISWANPNYLIVKAVGNDRGNSKPAGTPHYIWNGTTWVLTTANRDTVGPYDCIVTYGTAKNILTVGAIDILPNGFVSAPVNTISFSSWGPTDDGRIKPDLVCGTNTSSTPTSTNDSAYGSLGGTSISSPGAAASLLLVQQHYFNLKSKYMKASSLKGLAVHTANNLKTTLGPNYESGWGLLNTAKAAQTITDSSKNFIKEHNLNNNDTFKFIINVNGLDTFKTTLCWTDPPAIVGAPAYNDTTKKLINDLDIRLINNSTNVVYYPYILNPSVPSAAATNGDNFRDNVEQIYIPNLPSGNYTIRVTHKNNLQNSNPQALSIIASGVTLTATLPVKWLSFTGKNVNNDVQLDWQTAQEINNKCYEIERSTDNQNFTTIGIVNGRTNANTVSKYSYLDYLNNLDKTTELTDNIYYRLKQIDLDGQYHYSKTIILKAPFLASMSVYPNPFNESLWLKVNSNQLNQTFSVQIFDLLGREVYNKFFTNDSKQFDYEISEVKTLNLGIYILKFSYNNKTIVYKIIKTN
ncbi:MAG: S8 family peptidase [Candidatus Methylacidiphilales bacterium]